MDLTLRLGTPGEEKKPDETSGTAADPPSSSPSPPPLSMYNFFSKERLHPPTSTSAKGNFHQQFWKPRGGAVAVGGGVAIGPAAIIPVVAVPFPQGFVPVYRSPRKRPNPGGEAGNENRVWENCGTRRTPLWRKGPVRTEPLQRMRPQPEELTVRHRAAATLAGVRICSVGGLVRFFNRLKNNNILLISEKVKDRF
ncbi:uncharacterized protein LOC127243059 [Andrographis paniculata]|uniref:uncharacterized protein LOC127243059 n=1 Tax=Andrographis paniculata TaxID=175694 RepID=UPI0021E7E905|nr:uncharacterized protein LOC127243059 [Andrographis paniculata]